MSGKREMRWEGFAFLTILIRSHWWPSFLKKCRPLGFISPSISISNKEGVSTVLQLMMPEIGKIWLIDRCSLIIVAQGCRRMLSQTNLTFCSIFLHSLTDSLNPLWFIFPLEWNFSRGLKPSTRRESAMLSCSRLLSASDNKLSLVPLIRWWSLWWLWL